MFEPQELLCGSLRDTLKGTRQGTRKLKRQSEAKDTVESQLKKKLPRITFYWLIYKRFVLAYLVLDVC